MKLTTAQLQALKADIAANAAVLTAVEDPSNLGGSFVGVAINAISPSGRSQEGATAIANWYNELASAAFLAWSSRVPGVVIGNNLILANYTIVTSIAPDSTVLYTNLSNACIAKGIVLQNLLLVVQANGGLFDASQPTLRKALKDATSNIPAGAPAGTLLDGGWATSLGVVPGPLARQVTNVEKLFAVPTTGPLSTGAQSGLGTAANVSLAAYDGSQLGGLTFQDIFNAWGS